MKVALIFNESAGDGLDSDELVRALEAHGHQVLSVGTSQDEGERLADTGAELVVAAGGDGTVSRVARALAHSTVPMAILPLGTANNIATSLGVDVDGAPEQLIATWDAATIRPLDLGVGTGPWGERRFVESVGGGLVTHAMVVMDRQPSAEGPRDGEVTRALQAYREILPQLAGSHWKIRVDDDEVEGEFLLVEVLNMSHIGPNLRLTSQVDPADGRFSVVLAERSMHKQIDDYLSARLQNRDAPLDLPVRLAQRIEILAADRLHLDDEVVGEVEDGQAVGLKIEAAAVRLLCPDRALE